MDKLWKELEPQPMTSYIDLLVNQSKQYKRSECRVALPFVRSLGHTSKEYMMVTTCLPGYSKYETELCARISLNLFDIPVEGLDGYLYANHHCAHCNNVRKFISIKIYAKCNHRNETDISNITSFNNLKCRFDIVNTHGKLLDGSCNITIWNNYCPVTDVHYDLCKAYLAPVWGYANYHCWLCSRERVKKNDEKGENKCFPVRNIIQHPYGWSAVVSYTGVSVIDADTGTVVSQTTCQRGERFDIARNKCVQYDCVPGYYMREDSVCMKTKERRVKTSNHSPVITSNQACGWVITNVAILFLHLFFHFVD